MSSHGAHSGRQRGFTLLELLVVLVLAGVLIGLVGVQMSAAAPGAELRAATRDLASGLRYVRSQAISSGEEQVLYVDVDDGRYWFDGRGGRSHTLPESVSLQIVTAQEEIEDGSVGGLRFFPDGSATGGRITVTVNESSMEVDVNWLTGRISILES